MFQIKNFRSIVASMINVTRASQTKITDFSVGSVARTLMESPAVEIEELYLQMLLGLQDAIPIAIYQAFDFPALGALPAGGLVTLTLGVSPTDVLLIPAGTVLSTDAGQAFYTTGAAAVAVGETRALLTVVAVAAGAAGNIAANEISRISGFDSNTTVKFTHLAFTSGRDSETDLARKSRFIQFVRSLARGTTQAIKYCAGLATVKNDEGLVQEHVARVGFTEVPGMVNVYLYGSMGTPSAALIANCQALVDGSVDPDTRVGVDGYRAAGVEVRVSAMTARAVSLGVAVMSQIGVLHTSALTTSVKNAVHRVISGVQPGTTLRADAVVTAILGVPGVLSANLTGNANVVCSQAEFLYPGVVTVNWLANA